jgi:hypothetical protein
MDEGLSHGRYPDGLDSVAQLIPRQWPLLGQRPRDRGDTAVGRARGHAQLGQPPGVAGEELRRRQRVEPPVVLPTDEVQRAAVQPADDDRPLVGQRAVEVRDRQPAGARPNGEARASQILRLHREQAVTDANRVAGRLLSEELCRESRFENARYLAPPGAGTMRI